MHVNSPQYWDERFSQGDWRAKGGPNQSITHAQHYVPVLGISPNFRGIVCDFGCAEGDAMTVYQEYFPMASFIGVDISSSAIEAAISNYGHIARFICGTEDDIPDSDVIITSHVLEHLDNDESALTALLAKCDRLFVVVPYREYPLNSEHVRTYDEASFSRFRPKQITICDGGWQYKGPRFIWEIWIKNLARPLLGRRRVARPRQIVFEFNGDA